MELVLVDCEIYFLNGEFLILRTDQEREFLFLRNGGSNNLVKMI